MKEMSSEYAAVRDGGAGLMDLSASRGRIRVSGAEAVMFLNGLVTNDMKSLGENRWMPAAFANVQGRLIGAVRIVRGKEPAFLIDTDAASHEAVLKSISKFTLAGDFRVADVTAETVLMTIQGKRAGAIVEQVFEIPVSDLPRNGVVETNWRNVPVMIFRATHTAEDGFVFVVDAAQSSALQQAIVEAGAQPISENVAEILRVEAGIARYGRDMDETNVVTETNLDDALSYTKGCYLGQEIIVRIKHRGHVAKKLTGLQLDTDRQIDSGTTIKTIDGDQEIGRVTSAVVSPRLGSTIALGYVRFEHLAPGTQVKVNDVAATITELPFVRGSWYQNG
jgi:folate-binding protein YgfZ